MFLILPASSVTQDVEGKRFSACSSACRSSWLLKQKADDKKYIYIWYLSKGTQVILETEITESACETVPSGIKCSQCLTVMN